MIRVNDTTRVSYSEAVKVKLKAPPNAGDRWQGIPHKELIAEMAGAFMDQGWRSETETFGLSADQADIIAAYTFDRKNGPTVPLPESIGRGWVPSIAVRNSNARRLGMCLYVGLTGHWLGEPVGLPFYFIKVARLDQIYSVRSNLNSALLEAAFKFEDIKDDITKIQEELEPNENDYHATLIEAGRKNILPWHLIGQTDEVFVQNGRTYWDLFKAFALVAGRWNVPLKQLDRIMRFGSLIPGYPAGQPVPLK